MLLLKYHGIWGTMGCSLNFVKKPHPKPGLCPKKEDRKCTKLLQLCQFDQFDKQANSFFFSPTRLLLVLSYISNRQYLEAISSINNIPCSQQALYLKDDAYG